MMMMMMLIGILILHDDDPNSMRTTNQSEHLQPHCTKKQQTPTRVSHGLPLYF